ncbi:helix-turn-helix transcriptional regulator [Proteinivorax tanatarense]|uniref:Helix-turn-helix transcriptional regulator n=1 Tax=Proteinivorax tanatarense TaxID=1260629 RepID=A0AAU7VMY9_9FIRM
MDEQECLNFLKRLADGLTQMMGKNCEVVVHDMENFEQSIVYIKNSHVTNRKVGDPFKVLGQKDVSEFFNGTDLVNCAATTKDNRHLKSSTFHVKNENYHFAIGINYDYTNLSYLKLNLEDFLNVGDNIHEVIEEQSISDQMLEEAFDEAVKKIGKPVALMSKKDRIQVVKYLDQKGVFSVQKSIPVISEKLNVSRYSIYNYLKEIK